MVVHSYTWCQKAWLVMYAHVQPCMVVHSYAWWQKAWLVIYAHAEGLVGYLCSCHVWLCVAMHGGRRLGWSCLSAHWFFWVAIYILV